MPSNSSAARGSPSALNSQPSAELSPRPWPLDLSSAECRKAYLANITRMVLLGLLDLRPLVLGVFDLLQQALVV